MNTLINLPDFDVLFNLVQEIQTMATKQALLEFSLKLEEARIMIETSNNPKYFVGGKPPSKTYIESTYFFTGLDGELVKQREELVRLGPVIEAKKAQLRLFEKLIEVWRTQSANERTLSS